MATAAPVTVKVGATLVTATLKVRLTVSVPSVAVTVMPVPDGPSTPVMVSRPLALTVAVALAVPPLTV